MLRIPTKTTPEIKTNAGQSATFFSVKARPGDFGETHARQLKALGASLGDVAGAVDAFQRRKDTEPERDLFLDAEATRRRQLREIVDGYRGLAGKEAAEGGQAARDRLFRTWKDAGRGLAKGQRESLNRLTIDAFVDAANGIHEHEAVQREARRDEVSAEMIQGFTRNVMDSTSADADTALGNIYATVGDQARRKGWSSKVTEQRMQAAATTFHEAVFGARLEKSPELARQYLDRHRDDMDEPVFDGFATRLGDVERLLRQQTVVEAAATANDVTEPEGYGEARRVISEQLQDDPDLALKSKVIRRTIEKARETDSSLSGVNDKIAARGVDDLSPDEITAITDHPALKAHFDRVRAGDTAKSDLDLYDRLSELAPEELERTDLWQYRDRLANAEFEALRRRQQAVWKARDEGRSLPQPADDRDLKVDDADGGAVRGYIRRHREQALGRAAEERGIEIDTLPPEERKKILDRATDEAKADYDAAFSQAGDALPNAGPRAMEETIRQAADAQLTGGPEALAAFVGQQRGITGSVGDDVLLGEEANGEGEDGLQARRTDLLPRAKEIARTTGQPIGAVMRALIEEERRKIDEQIERGPTDGSPATQAPRKSPNRHEIIESALDPNISSRGMLLPLGRTKDGELDLAVPELVIDLAKSLMIPGDAAKGHPVTEREVTELASELASGFVIGRAGSRGFRELFKRFAKKKRPRAVTGENRYKTTNDGHQFVQLEDGRIDLGEIDSQTAADIGMEPAKIRLEKGQHDPETDKGFGDIHIEARHWYNQENR